jgi:hypothetical protein
MGFGGPAPKVYSKLVDKIKANFTTIIDDVTRDLTLSLLLYKVSGLHFTCHASLTQKRLPSCRRCD